MTNEQLPENFAQLKKSVNRAANWEERLQAVNELAQYNTDETTKILQYVAKADLVTKVREAAAKHLRKLGHNVPAVELPKGGLFKDENKVFLRIKKSLPADHTFEDYKEKLANMRSDIYNTYAGEKSADFEAWLEARWAAIVTKK